MKKRDNVTISAAASLKGVARSTVQRWIRSGRLKKTKAGLVSLAAVERCLDEWRTGRPPGRRVAQFPSVAERLAAPYLGAEGVRRLRSMLCFCANELGYRGKLDSLTGVLSDALTSAQRGSEYRKREDARREAKGG